MTEEKVERRRKKGWERKRRKINGRRKYGE